MGEACTQMQRQQNLLQIIPLLLLLVLLGGKGGEAQLRRDYYNTSCPQVEQIVRAAVQSKMQQTFVTIPATLRLFFHDCFVQGCDASIMIMSRGENKAEKDNSDNLSLAGDGFDTVVKARAAIDAVPSCKNQVSCADVLALAARDVVFLAGGPLYEVELGRRDGMRSRASDVDGKLPQPGFNLDQLDSLFFSNGLSRSDMVALSGAHTIGFSHCNRFANRLYGFGPRGSPDPTMNRDYAKKLAASCPKNANPLVAVDMDPTTPRLFDNEYYKNLVEGKGLFTSDQVLFTDRRSRGTVKAWADNSTSFQQAFISAMTKLGRVGVKTGSNGNIRLTCDTFNP